MFARADRLWSPSVPVGWKVDVAEGGAERTSSSADELARADDRELVAACRAGQREAFDVLVARHQRALYRLCYRFVGNPDDASDLAQEVFLRAYRALGRFKGDAAFTTWLYRIAVNVCLNYLSARRPVHEPIDNAPLPVTTTDDPVERVWRDERARRIRAAIAKLPPKQRATLLLRIYGELPHETIARTLGSSVGAAKANLFHALANLKKLLDGEKLR